MQLQLGILVSRFVAVCLLRGRAISKVGLALPALLTTSNDSTICASYKLQQRGFGGRAVNLGIMDADKKLLEDLSVAVVRLYVGDRLSELGGDEKSGVSIFSTGGPTGLRYAREVDRVTRVTLCAKRDGGVEEMVAADGRVEVVRDKPTMVMYAHRKHCDRFDVIDLDPPTASPSTYLDTAMTAVADGGLLLVTCSDTAVSAGQSPETCYRDYGAVSLKLTEDRRCDEFTLRVLLKCVESHANRHGRYIVPLLSVSAGSCARVFLRVSNSPVICKQTLSKLSWVYQCTGCGTLTLQPLGVAEKRDGVQKNVFKFSVPRGPPVGKLCPHCGRPHKVGGPIWGAPIQCPAFVSRVGPEQTAGFESEARLRKVLDVVQREMHEACMYFTEAQLRAVAGHDRCAEDVKTALKNAGFKVSRSHCDKTSIKTDASSRVVWDTVRCWAVAEQLERGTIDIQEGGEGKPASNILAQTAEFQADFTTRL